MGELEGGLWSQAYPMGVNSMRNLVPLAIPCPFFVDQERTRLLSDSLS